MTDELINKIASDIKQARKSLGLTQSSFAKLFNSKEPIELQTSRVNICKYETGKMICPTTKYLKFLDIAKQQS